MQKLSFNLVSDKRTSRFDIGISQKFFWTGIIGFIIFFILNWFLKKFFNINSEELQFIKYILFGCVICFMIGNFYGLFESNGNNTVIKGFITFDENEITINNAKTYSIFKVSNLKFDGYDYIGRYINIMSDGDPIRSYGGDNYVEFNYLNEKFRFQFVVNSPRHRELLNEEIIPKMKLKNKFLMLAK